MCPILHLKLVTQPSPSKKTNLNFWIGNIIWIMHFLVPKKSHTVPRALLQLLFFHPSRDPGRLWKWWNFKLRCDSEVECLPSICEVLGLISSTTKRKRKKKTFFERSHTMVNKGVKFNSHGSYLALFTTQHCFCSLGFGLPDLKWTSSKKERTMS